MGCFSKFFLFVLNFIVFGIGVGVITLASIILANSGQFEVLISSGTFTVPVILLILGIIVMIIGFFGCFGALRESPCLLYSYASVVLVLLVAQVAVVIYGFVKKDDILETISDGMIEIFEKYGDPTNLDFTQSLDVAQHKLQCCGVFNYTDWFNGQIESDVGINAVPIGCCRVNQTGCNLDANKPYINEEALIYTKGCYTALIDLIKGETLWLGIGAIVLGLVQLACVVIACGIGKKGGQHHSVY